MNALRSTQTLPYLEVDLDDTRSSQAHGELAGAVCIWLVVSGGAALQVLCHGSTEAHLGHEPRRRLLQVETARLERRQRLRLPHSQHLG